MGRRRIFLLSALFAAFFSCVISAEEATAFADATTLVAGRFLTAEQRSKVNSDYLNGAGRTRGGKKTLEDVLVEAWEAGAPSAEVSVFNISIDEAMETYVEIWNRHAEFFNVAVYTKGVGWNYDPGKGTLISYTIKYASSDANEVKRQNEVLDAVVEQFLADAESFSTPIAKALYVHDWLATNCKYDTTLERTHCRDVYGALVEGEVVCAGYAIAYKWLLEKLNVPCEYITSEGLNHAWNVVRLDGNPYHVDVTWDDPTWQDNGERKYYVRRDNFLRSDDGIADTGHCLNGDSQNRDWEITSWGSCESTRFDGYFWQDSSFCPIPCVGDTAYSVGQNDGILKKYRLSTGKAEKEIVTVDEEWPCPSGGFYSAKFSNAIGFHGVIFYNGPDKLWFFDPNTEKTILYTGTLSGNSGSIFHFWRNGKTGVLEAVYKNKTSDSDSQSDYVEIPWTAVTGVSLNKSSASLAAGNSTTLKATVAPANASYKGVTWSTSNPNIAVVNENGVITTKKNGSVIISATTVDGGHKATCSLTVTVPISVTKVVLSPSSASLAVGKKLTLTATVSPSNATNPAVTWSSSNSAVATVSNGIVTARKAGKATIKVVTADGGKTASCALTVLQPVTGVALDKSTAALMFGDEALQLAAVVSPQDASDKSVIWTSSDPAVATVADGLVTPVAKGSATITVTTVDGGKAASCAITVDYPPNALVLQKGWNLVAFQRHPVDMDWTDGMSLYEFEDGQYVKTVEILKNRAYWVYSATERVVIFHGEEFSEETVSSGGKWEFVGISDSEAQTETSAAECFKWQEGHFRQVNPGEALEPGRGYLMRVDP